MISNQKVPLAHTPSATPISSEKSGVDASAVVTKLKCFAGCPFPFKSGAVFLMKDPLPCYPRHSIVLAVFVIRVKRFSFGRNVFCEAWLVARAFWCLAAWLCGAVGWGIPE